MNKKLCTGLKQQQTNCYYAQNYVLFIKLIKIVHINLFHKIVMPEKTNNFYFYHSRWYDKKMPERSQKCRKFHWKYCTVINILYLRVKLWRLGSKIKSLMIRISSLPNSNVDFVPIQNLLRKLHHIVLYWSLFNQIQPIFD